MKSETKSLKGKIRFLMRKWPENDFGSDFQKLTILVWRTFYSDRFIFDRGCMAVDQPWAATWHWTLTAENALYLPSVGEVTSAFKSITKPPKEPKSELPDDPASRLPYKD